MSSAKKQMPVMAPSVPAPVFDKEDKCKDKPPEMPLMDSVIHNIYKGIDQCDGKTTLMATGTFWDEEEKCWVTEDKPICKMTELYKPGSALPPFVGFIEVYLADGTIARVHGNETVPETMIGALLCVEGEFCYFGYPPPQAIPNEVQIGGDVPGPESEVEIWVDNGIAKTKNPDGIWVQSKNFGA